MPLLAAGLSLSLGTSAQAKGGIDSPRLASTTYQVCTDTSSSPFSSGSPVTLKKDCSQSKKHKQDTCTTSASTPPASCDGDLMDYISFDGGITWQVQ